MSKKIFLVLSNNYQYTIDLMEVVNHRNNYYKSLNLDDFNEEEETEYVMNDDFEGLDWLQNNMDWYNCETLKLYKKPSEDLSELEIEGCEIFDTKDFKYEN